MLTQTIIQKTLRVPRADGPAGDGAGVARQMDAVLAGVGFKAARDLLEHVSGLAPGAAMDLAVQVVGAVRGLVGDHVAHNAYFIDFPDGVPDTMEFWVRCLRDALAEPRAVGDRVPSDVELLTASHVNLLSLPLYGRYQHTYADLLAVQDELVASAKDRVTVLHLGDTLDAEAGELYLALAGSTTPLGGADPALLARLAETCGEVVPERIPVRENRAVVNAVRLAAGRPLVAVDTVVDVLRVACQASGGDVTLAAPTRFRGFARRERRVLLAALDQVGAASSPTSPATPGRSSGWGSGCTRTSTPSSRAHVTCSRSPAASGPPGPWRGARRWRSPRATSAVPRRSSPPRPACCCGRWTGCCVRPAPRRSWTRCSTRRPVCWRRCRVGCCARCANTSRTARSRTPRGCSPPEAAAAGSRRTPAPRCRPR